MRKIRQVLEYRLTKEISAEQTAFALTISKGSVINIVHRFEESGLSWPLPQDLTDSALEEALFPPQIKDTDASVPLPDIVYIEKELARPHVTIQCLWEQYHEQHPDGLQRSAFYNFISANRSPSVTMKMFHKGGDKLFVDYSGDGLEYINRVTGEIIDVVLFVCTWGASSFSYAECTESQRTEDFTLSHVRAMNYFGVVPNAFVPDNLKSGVSKPDRYDPVINPLYEKMARHYNVAILPARVRKPRDKAVIESNVLHIQRFILARLRDRQFFSLDEVNCAVREQLELFNNRPMKEYGGQSRRERFVILDKPYAKTLPLEQFKISQVKTDIRVAPNYHIRFENHFYSVPFHLAGKCVDVYRSGSIIEIYHDNVHLCRHQIGTNDYGYTTVNEHMPPNHAFVKGWRKEWFIQKAKEIGPATAQATEQIMSSREHVQQGFNAAMGLLRLKKIYTSERIEKACQRALHFKTVSFRTIKTILEQHLDNQTFLQLTPIQQPPVIHENIRGPQYYVNA